MENMPAHVAQADSITTGSQDVGWKRSESALQGLTVRQRDFVVGKLEGKSDRCAALEAGYALSTAENTKQKIMSRPEVQKAFQELLAEWIPLETLVQCVRDGLDATRVKYFHRQDGSVETLTLPDHRVRLLYVMLALKIRGLEKPPDPAQEPVKVQISWVGESEKSASSTEVL